MTTNAQSLLILCGGRSPEHDISILSAKNVVKKLMRDQRQLTIGYIARDGRWLCFDDVNYFLEKSAEDLNASDNGFLLSFTPGLSRSLKRSDGVTLPAIDCVLPILHGANGEDGVVQGFLETLNLPYIGADVLGASVTMHKDATKRLLKQAGLPVVDWLFLTKETAKNISYEKVTEKLGFPIFVKANSLGSSIGVYKVKNAKQYDDALYKAFSYDNAVLLEKAVHGREIECSVLGGQSPIASLPGEVINHTEFYSYDAKYTDKNAATVQTPADLPESIIAQIKQLAVQAVNAVYCEGMARVDFFLTSDCALYINEINAIPGFTDISMYPKNWEVSGISQPELFDRLIELAVMRSKKTGSHDE